jgi:tungstate transport system substrate-binding protein
MFARGRLHASAVGRRVAFLLVIVATGCDAPHQSRHLVLATTTSVANSGLLDPLLAGFHEDHGIVIRSHLVGSGLALRMLETSDADAVISHAQDTETSFLQAHADWQYRKIMFNDFVLVGPPGDPAHARDAQSAADAMRRIAEPNTRFISRGDGSGTHEREQELWAVAGAKPESPRLVVAGSSMGTTLRIASETGAYTLTDRATLLRYAGALELAIVFERGPLLLNTYAVVVDPGGRRANDARAFFRWLTEGRGRDVIDSYRMQGIRGFTVWPTTVPGSRPDALPQ